MNRNIIIIFVVCLFLNGCKSLTVINESDNPNAIEISAANFEKLLDTNYLPPYSNGYLTRVRGRFNVDVINIKFIKIELDPLDSLLYIKGGMFDQQDNNYELGHVIIGQLPNLLEEKLQYPLTIYTMIILKNNGEFEFKVKIKDNMQLLFGSKLFSKLKTYNIYKLLRNYNNYVKLNSDEILLQDSCICIKDSLNAVQFAKKEFVKVYGADVLKQEPFVAVLRDTIWYVEGTFPYNTNSFPSSESIPDSIDSNGTEYYSETVAVGGVAYIRIDKKTCKIIEINHGE